MRGNVSSTGCIFRIRCNYREYNPHIPYDLTGSSQKIGTGFLVVINNVPMIVTAHHVVSNHISVLGTMASFESGEPIPLEVLGFNPSIDIALLLPPASMVRALTPFLMILSSTYAEVSLLKLF